MNAKTTKKPSKPAPAKAVAKSKAASGLLSKLKGALAKKAAPAAVKKTVKTAPVKAAKKAAPAPKPAPKTTTPAKKAAAPAKASAAPAKAPMKSAKPATKQAAVKEAAPVAKAVATATATKKPATAPRKTSSPIKGPLTEELIRQMDDDDYMNDAQLEFFKQRLLTMRAEVLEREVDVKERLHQREVFADPADRATAEEEHWLDLRLRERESLLLRKIDEALRRIDGREYGYCEKTGDPIGIPRLLARPTATVCVDIKGQDERVEAQFRDR